MPSQAAVRHASTACTGTQRLWRYLCPSVVHSARRLLCGERLARACCRLLHIAPGGPEEWCASWWLAALPMCCLQRKFTRGPLGYGKRESERAKGAYKDRAGRAFHIVTTTVVSRLHLPVNGSSLDISMSLLQRLSMSHNMAVMALSAGRRINRQQTNRWIPYLTRKKTRCRARNQVCPPVPPLQHYSSSDCWKRSRESCLTAVPHARFPHRP